MIATNWVGFFPSLLLQLVTLWINVKNVCSETLLVWLCKTYLNNVTYITESCFSSHAYSNMYNYYILLPILFIYKVIN